MKDANEIDNQGMIPLEGRGKGRERRTKKIQDGNNGSILIDEYERYSNPRFKKTGNKKKMTCLQ